MSFNADSHNQPRDVAFKPAGVGMAHSWQCMFCGQKRGTTAGSKGKPGAFRRCAECVAAKQARAA